MIELILSLIVLLFHVAYLVVYYSTFSFYDVWYFAIAMTLSAGFFYTEFKSKLSSKFLFKISWLEVFLFCFVALLGLYCIDSRSIWIDEYSQYVAANPINEYFSLSRGAAVEQQPPFGYLVTAIFSFIFGANVVGLRLSSVVFMALSCIYLKRTLKNYAVSTSIILTTFFLYLSQTTIFNFLIEGRPYAQALFFSVFFIEYYVRIILKKEKFSAWKFLFILYFLVNSLGLQTGILALSLFLAFAAYDRGKESLKLFSYSLLCLLFFSPILFQIYHWSNSLNQFKDSIGRTDLFNYGYSLARNYWLNLLGYGPRGLEYAFLIAIFCISLLTKWRRGQLVMLTQIVFFVLFVLSFFFIINWNMYLKYYVVAIPLLIITIGIALQFVLEKIFIVRNKYVDSLLIFIVLLNFLPMAINFERVNEFLVDNRNMPWKSVFNYFKKSLNGEDSVYFLTFNEPGEWALTKPVAKEFYLRNNLERYVGEEYIPNSVLTLPKFSVDQSTKGIVYLVSPSNWSNDHINDVALIGVVNNLEILYKDGIRIFKLSENEKTENQRLIHLFQSIVDMYGPYSWTYTIRASLIRLYALEKDYEKQDRELKNLNEMKWPERKSLSGSWPNRDEIVRELTPYFSKHL